MALWLIRAGSSGQFEAKFIGESRVFVTWDDLNRDLRKFKDQISLRAEMSSIYPDAKPKTLMNNAAQIWPFVHEMDKGDWFVMPLKSQPVVWVGEIAGDYQFHPQGPNPFFHSRKVNWIGKDIPRGNFAQDLLYSFGAFMTICRISRNNAEERVKSMAKKAWAAESTAAIATGGSKDTAQAETAETDLEAVSHQQIARVIKARFKGHGLARLVEAIVQAQGFKTFRSPPGPDGGIDILAAPGALGFGEPRIAIQVKSQDDPVDLGALKHLKGAMADFRATRGILVAWAGFKSSVQKEEASSFFDTRLWNQDDVIAALFAHYGELEADIRAELPLKQIWTIASAES